jgi:hypothetical protein
VNVVLWVLQILLAVAFCASGLGKLSSSKDRLAERMRWVEGFSPGAIKTIGGLELLAALGLILPPLTGIAVVLAPSAAVGLVLVMAGAAIVHARIGEKGYVLMNLLLLILAGIVAWGRFGPYAFGTG